MMLVVLAMLLVAVELGCAVDSDQPLYACPHQSWCVPATYCPADMVTFRAPATQNYSVSPSDHYKFMCGVTVDTDGDLCCRELGALPEHFIPSLTHWHFLDKNSSVERLPMQVLAWPGYGTDEDDSGKDKLKTDPHAGAPQVSFSRQLHFICPGISVCVPAYNCPPQGIYYTVDVPSPSRGKFLCGVTAGSEGWLCCSLHVIKDARGERRRPARHPVQDDHEVLIRISFDLQKSHERTGADVAQYSRTSHAAAPPPLPLAAIHLPDYYEDDHISDVDGSLLQGRKLLGPPKRRYRRDTDDIETSVENELSNETYAIHGAADRGNVTLHTVTRATLINDIPLAARSKLPYEEKGCGEPLAPHAPHRSPDTPLASPIEGQYPWHVAVLTRSGEYLCGGVIVTERHVLTVAHCINQRFPSQVLIRVGDFNLVSDSEIHPSYDVPVSRITCHPEFSRTTLRADVCVVQLRVAVLWLPNVRRVCLPGETSHPDPSVECFVPSWGYVSKGQDGKIYDSFAPQLRHLPFLAIDGTRCQRELRKIKKLGSFFKLNSGVLCSKGTASPDTCHGDGGSGLVCRSGSDSQQGQYTLTGLVSWDMGCENGKPTAYVDIAYYLNFILRIIGATLEGGRLHIGRTQATGTSDTHNIEASSTQYKDAYSVVSHASETSQFGATSQASGGLHNTSSQSSGVLYSASSQSDTTYSISSASASDHSTTTQYGYGATSHSDSSYGVASHSGSSSYSANFQSDSSYNSNYNSQSSGYIAELPDPGSTYTTFNEGDGQNQHKNSGVHKVDPYLTGIPSRPSRPLTVDDGDNKSHDVSHKYYDKQGDYSNKQTYTNKYTDSVIYEKKDDLHKYDRYDHQYEDIDFQFTNIQPERYQYNGNRKYDGSGYDSNDKLGYDGKDKPVDVFDKVHDTYYKYDTGDKYGRYDVQNGVYARDKYVSDYYHEDDRYGSDHYGEGTYDPEFQQVTGYNRELGHNSAHTATSISSYNQESFVRKEYLNQDKPYYNDRKYYYPNSKQFNNNEKSYDDHDTKYYIDGKYYDANKYKYFKDGKYYDIDFKEGKHYESGQYFFYKDGKYYRDGKYDDVDQKHGKYYESGKHYDQKNGKYKNGKYYDADDNQGQHYKDGKHFDYKDLKHNKGEYYDADYHEGKYRNDDKYYDYSGAYYKEHRRDSDRSKYHKDFNRIGYNKYHEDRQKDDENYGHDMYYDYNAEHYKDIDYSDGKYYLNGGYYFMNEHGKYNENGQYYDMDYKNGKYYKDGNYYDFDDHGKYYKDGKYYDIDFNHGKYYYNGNFYDFIDGAYYMNGKYYDIDYDNGKYYEGGRYYSFNKRGQYLKDGKYYDIDYSKGKYYKDGKYHELNEHGKYYRDGNWYDIDYQHGKYYKDGEFYDVASKSTGHKDRDHGENGKNPDVENVLYYHKGKYYPYNEGKYYKDAKYYDVDPNDGRYYENGKYYTLNINGKYNKNGNYYDMDYKRGKYYKDGKHYESHNGKYNKDGKYFETEYNDGKFYSEGRYNSYYKDGHLYDYVENGKYHDFYYEGYHNRPGSYDQTNYEDGLYASGDYIHNQHGQYGKKPVNYGDSGSRNGGYGHNYVKHFGKYFDYGDQKDFSDKYYDNFGPDKFIGYYNGKYKNYDDKSYGENDYTHRHYYGDFKDSYKSENYDLRDSKYYEEREIYGKNGLLYADGYGRDYDNDASKDNRYKLDNKEGPAESGVHYHYHYYRRKSGLGEKGREGREKQDYDQLVSEASSEATEHSPVAMDEASQDVHAEASKEVKVSDNEINSTNPGSIVGYLKRLQVTPQ